jgi:hypothetical protein
VACCSMQRSVVIGSGRVVVSAYGIAGTKALPFKGGPENLDKSPGDLDETAQRALIACGGGVDQDPALNRPPWVALEYVDALLQSAGGISAIDRHLAHQGVRETVHHHILGPLAFAEAILATNMPLARLAWIQAVAPA